MDRISKIGLTLTIILLIGWFYWQGQKAKIPIEDMADEEGKEEIRKEAKKLELVKESPPEEMTRPVVDREMEDIFPDSSEKIKIETELISATMNNFGGVIQNLVLLENPGAGIRKLPDEPTGEVSLLAVDSPQLALGALTNLPFFTMDIKKNINSVEFSGITDEGIYVVKEYVFKKDKYIAELNLKIQNNSGKKVIWEGGPNLVCGTIQPIDQDDILGVDIMSPDGVARKKGPVEKVDGKIDWIGLKTKYFVSIVKPETHEGMSYWINAEKKEKLRSEAAFGCARGPGASVYRYLRATMAFDKLALEVGEKVEYKFLLFLGPANLRILKSEGEGFESVIDLGFFSRFYIPQAIIWLLGKIYGFIGSFGWAIIFLTVIIKIILWPLTHKSYQSMKEMQKLQPKIAELKERYKKDAKKIQTETMKLYKEHGVNPMGGCLPMLFQMPILFALFITLRNTILLRKASFWIIPGHWIQDLSGPDKLATLPNSYPIIGDQLNILPLLMGVTFFLQQKFTPTSAGANPQSAQQQKMMSTMMPIFFTFIFYTLPAGLNLYFMLSTLITVVQQVTAKSK